MARLRVVVFAVLAWKALVWITAITALNAALLRREAHVLLGRERHVHAFHGAGVVESLLLSAAAVYGVLLAELWWQAVLGQLRVALDVVPVVCVVRVAG